MPVKSFKNGKKNKKNKIKKYNKTTGALKLRWGKGRKKGYGYIFVKVFIPHKESQPFEGEKNHELSLTAVWMGCQWKVYKIHGCLEGTASPLHSIWGSSPPATGHSWFCPGCLLSQSPPPLCNASPMCTSTTWGRQFVLKSSCQLSILNQTHPSELGHWGSRLKSTLKFTLKSTYLYIVPGIVCSVSCHTVCVTILSYVIIMMMGDNINILQKCRNVTTTLL